MENADEILSLFKEACTTYPDIRTSEYMKILDEYEEQIQTLDLALNAQFMKIVLQSPCPDLNKTIIVSGTGSFYHIKFSQYLGEPSQQKLLVESMYSLNGWLVYSKVDKYVVFGENYTYRMIITMRLVDTNDEEALESMKYIGGHGSWPPPPEPPKPPGVNLSLYLALLTIAAVISLVVYMRLEKR